MVMYFLGFLCGLLKRPFEVAWGMGFSTKHDVFRGGLVMDLNAIALAISVVLLLTSRDTFRSAELTIKENAWKRLVWSHPRCASQSCQCPAGIRGQLTFRAVTVKHWQLALQAIILWCSMGFTDAYASLEGLLHIRCM